MTLETYFQMHPKAALGLSGGVDSAYLLYAAVHCGADVRPFFVKTPFQPQFELDDALRLGRELGVPVTVLPFDVLSVPEVAANPRDRCYYCKHALFGRLREAAVAEGYSLLLDGTNASDDPEDRPGTRAIAELHVESPLRLCGLTKDAIRRLSQAAGLFTWNKPAYACLATRIPAGTAITEQALSQVEAAEAALARLGFSDFRVRVFHGAARIQLKPAQMAAAVSQRERLLAALRPCFDTIVLDLEGR